MITDVYRPRLLPSAPISTGHRRTRTKTHGLILEGGHQSLVAIAIPLCIVGLGGGITTPSTNFSALDAVERERSGLVSGILNTARQTGGVIGAALLGALIGGPATATEAKWAAVAAAVSLASASVLAAVIARKPCFSAATPVELR